MQRKLSAVEIAEGALLADIAIIFQLIATYLPVGSQVFQLLERLNRHNLAKPASGADFER